MHLSVLVAGCKRACSTAHQRLGYQIHGARERLCVLSQSYTEIRCDVSKVRFILVGLICALPVILFFDGLIAQALLAAGAAAGLVGTAYALRPGETAFLITISRPLLFCAAVPLVWMVVQVLPVPWLAHPYWASAESALGHPITGTISVDPGATVLSLGEYLVLGSVTFLAAAVGIDRQRAGWILVALTGAIGIIGLLMLAHDLFLSRIELPPSSEPR